MRNIIFLVLCASFLLFSNGTATAEPALKGEQKKPGEISVTQIKNLN